MERKRGNNSTAEGRFLSLKLMPERSQIFFCIFSTLILGLRGESRAATLCSDMKKHRRAGRTCQNNIFCVAERMSSDGKKTESCGKGELKRKPPSSQRKQCIQNKWEVNTYPQEAIKCCKDQLGPSRCPCLRLSQPKVWRSLSVLTEETRGGFHLLSHLKERISTTRSLKFFIVLSDPHPTNQQVQVFGGGGGNYTLQR